MVKVCSKPPVFCRWLFASKQVQCLADFVSGNRTGARAPDLREAWVVSLFQIPHSVSSFYPTNFKRQRSQRNGNISAERPYRPASPSGAFVCPLQVPLNLFLPKPLRHLDDILNTGLRTFGLVQSSKEWNVWYHLTIVVHFNISSTKCLE